MNITYRQGDINDLEKLKQLAIAAWSPFQNDLTSENWKQLFHKISNDDTFLELLHYSHPIICETDDHHIIGMAFLVPKGNPTEIYDEQWSYIRFVSVHPQFGGQGIGRQLIKQCIELAVQNKEQTIALHTSEMMAKARYLYESLGFNILRELKPILEKRYWLYTLDL